MTITKKVGTRSQFGKALWTYAIVYILLITALLAVTTSVLANNPPGVEIVEPAPGSTLTGNVTVWIVAWDPDGNDQIQEVWVQIDGGDTLNATYNHTDAEGQ